MVLLEPKKTTIMGLNRSAIFGSVGHQTSCDIYISKNSSVLKSQLFINLSLSHVVASFQVQMQLVWNINPSPDLSHSTPERLLWTQIYSLYTRTDRVMDFYRQYVANEHNRGSTENECWEEVLKKVLLVDVTAWKMEKSPDAPNDS